MFEIIFWVVIMLGFARATIQMMLGNFSAAFASGGFAAIFAVMGIAVLSTIGGSDKADSVTNTADMPDFLQPVMESFFPERYVERRVDDVGVLESITLERGILTDLTTIETSNGFFTVVGVVKSVDKVPVYVSGLNDERLEDRLCIGSEHTECYRMTRNGT